MKEKLETSIGAFKITWHATLLPARDVEPRELVLTLEADSGQPWRARVSSAGEIAALLIQAGVAPDEARSLSTDLWERRWRADDDIRRMNDEAQEFRRVRSELKEHWGDLTELSPIRLVRQWIAFVAVVEVGYDDGWEYYGNELMTREYIAELCRRLPGRRAAYFEESVAPWDERFRAATTERPEPFSPPGEAGESAWWCYRWPRLWTDDPD